MALTRAERTKLTIFLACLVAVFALIPLVLPAYREAESFLATSPVLGPALYMLLMIGAILIAPLPASPLAILAGTVFGPWLGMLYTLVAATLGALLAFFIARFFLGEVARNHLKSYTWYKKLNHQNEHRIALAVALTRLMPQVSFDLISFAAGLTKIRPLLFALATFLGMIPIVFILSFFGAFLKSYQGLVLALLLILALAYAFYKIKR